MITEANISVRPAKKNDRNRLANILHFEPHVHRHLDWRPPLDWLGYSPYLVAEKEGRLVAALACPPDPPGVAWIRVFAVSNRVEPTQAWDLLWDETQSYLTELKAEVMAAIPLQSWFRGLLESKGFEHSHSVVVLYWENNATDIPPANPKVKIRLMEENEIDAVQKVDETAFGHIWRNSVETLKLAYDQALLATVAEDEQGLIGYQISTPSPFGAHLARLAVHPRAQRQGVAYALVADLQNHFKSGEQRRLSVNTQDHNLASLALYKKAGFVQSGEEYPVYIYQLMD
jgi:ribosomal protein S18 acetylase RimI-like enzyme